MCKASGASASDYNTINDAVKDKVTLPKCIKENMKLSKMVYNIYFKFDFIRYIFPGVGYIM